jgi:hypothetical protein
MAQTKEAPAIPERATQAETRPTTERLSDFQLKPESFYHRDQAELADPDRLKPLMDSLAVEGLQTPVELFRGPDGKPVPTKGHRRISAMRQLAKQNTPGFTPDMLVAALEVLNATPQDLLCRSVSDNTVRQNLTMGERIRAALTLHKGGVEANRAAYALSYSTKQYLRDLRVAQQAWMLEHVEKDRIGHTVAGDLLEAAEKVGLVAGLKAHLDRWVAAREKEVAATGKEKKLKSLLTKSLADHWVGLLRQGLFLNDIVEAPEEFQADIDPGANRVTLDAELDLMNAPLEHLEKAEIKLARVLTVVAKYRQARGALEGQRGPQDHAREAAEELKRLAVESTTDEPRPASTPNTTNGAA